MNHFKQEPLQKQNACTRYDIPVLTTLDDINTLKNDILSRKTFKHLTNILDKSLEVVFNQIGYGLFVVIDHDHGPKQPIQMFVLCNISIVKPDMQEALNQKEALNSKGDAHTLYTRLFNSTLISNKISSVKKAFNCDHSGQDECRPDYHTVTNSRHLVSMKCLLWYWKDWWKNFDYYSSTMFNFLIETNKKHRLNNNAFILNYFDTPIWPKYTCIKNIYTEAPVDKGCLTTGVIKRGEMLPVFSFTSSDKHNDIMIPFPDVWEMATKNRFGSYCRSLYNDKPYSNIPWQEKRNQLVFRGRNTSCHPNDIQRNARLKYLHFLLSQQTEIKKEFFNVGISSLTTSTLMHVNKTYNDKVVIDWSNLDKIRHQWPTFELKKAMSMAKQSQYKFILDMDGYATSWRLPYEMTYNSVICLQRSDLKSWFYDFSGFQETHLPFSNTSELLHVLKMATKQENETKNIIMADKALKFAEKHFSVDALTLFMATTLNKNCVCQV